MPRAGDKVGPFTLVKKIGSGGFGVVWLAEKHSPIAVTKFALKFTIDLDLSLETIKQEVAVWIRATGHPHVLPIIDADIYDDQAVIVSEYAPDGSLTDWLKKHGGKAPSIEAAITMTSGILSGLEHLHTQKIIHRDLKPDNILLQGSIPRLADFGVARLWEKSTEHSKARGTIAYMAPEAFDGYHSPRTDIWSVGVILYKLLAGKLPFQELSELALMMAIRTREPIALSLDTPDSIRKVVARALQKDSSLRYKSAFEMKSDLHTTIEIDQSRRRLNRQGSSFINEKPSTEVLPVESTLLFQTTKFQLSEEAEGSKILRGHIGTVYTVAFSPDGRFLLSGGEDRMMRLWDVKSGQEINRFSLHPKGVKGVAFSNDGRRAFSTSETQSGSQLFLWDIDNGKQLQTWRTYSKYTTQFSFDQRLVICKWAYQIHVLEVESGKLIRKLELETFHRNPCFSPDGWSVLVGCADSYVYLFDIGSGRATRKFTLCGDYAEGLAFSPDGRFIASSDKIRQTSISNTDWGTRLWDVKSGQEVYCFETDLLAHGCLAFSPDSAHLLTVNSSFFKGPNNHIIHIWYIKSGKAVKSFRGHTAQIRSAVFSPDGQMVASCSQDSTIRLWNLSI